MIKHAAYASVKWATDANVVLIATLAGNGVIAVSSAGERFLCCGAEWTRSRSWSWCYGRRWCGSSGRSWWKLNWLSQFKFIQKCVTWTAGSFRCNAFQGGRIEDVVVRTVLYFRNQSYYPLNFRFSFKMYRIIGWATDANVVLIRTLARNGVISVCSAGERLLCCGADEWTRSRSCSWRNGRRWRGSSGRSFFKSLNSQVKRWNKSIGLLPVQEAVSGLTHLRVTGSKIKLFGHVYSFRIDSFQFINCMIFIKIYRRIGWATHTNVILIRTLARNGVISIKATSERFLCCGARWRWCSADRRSTGRCSGSWQVEKFFLKLFVDLWISR